MSQLSEQRRTSAPLYQQVDVPAYYGQPVPSSSAYAGLRTEEREIARQRRRPLQDVRRLSRSRIRRERSPGEPYSRPGSRQGHRLGRDYVPPPTVISPPLSSSGDIPAYRAATVGTSAMPVAQQYVGDIAR